MDDHDYVLGTHDDEVERLGRQHAVWRPSSLSAWRAAGFSAGDHLLDVGCGPGYASCDLGELVGPTGRVVGIDRSQRFLDAARRRASNLGLTWIDLRACDLDEDPIPEGGFDGAWCRWVCSFVQRREAVPAQLRDALRPGAPLVLHEYYDYGAWRILPSAPAFERFVKAVMRSWRDAGGEPDVGGSLPRWLEAAGFVIVSVRSLVDLARPGDAVWSWPAGFARAALPRLVASGHLAKRDADRARAALDSSERGATAMMVTPAVMEIVAVRM